MSRGLLRRLDQKVLPPLGRAMYRLGRGATRMRLLTVVAIIAVTGVLVAAVWGTQRRPTSDPTLGQTVQVGVVQGQSVPAYVQASRRELAALVAAPVAGPTPTETYALVTLTAYLAPDRLTPVLGGVTLAQVFARVPLPDTQTEIVRIPAFHVPGDIVSGMADVATRKAAEASEYQRLVGRLTGDGERERQLRAVYTSGAQVATAEATAYRERCSCVYAAVVRATPGGLQRIAARPEVRAVDPAPEVRRLDRAVFLPPLPEQTDVVRPPSDGAIDVPPSASAAPSPADAGPVTSPTTDARITPEPNAVPTPPTPAPPSPAPAPTG
ncbi:MAG TPA: hypothetical protein VFE14_13350 [Micromonosporaceae bacterium]|nr:hypothetical protein [Micromonosporaceae bacterium]